MSTEERLRELSGELYTDYQRFELLVAAIEQHFYPDGAPFRLDDSPAGQALERLPEAVTRLFDQWDALRAGVESHYGKSGPGSSRFDRWRSETRFRAAQSGGKRSMGRIDAVTVDVERRLNGLRERGLYAFPEPSPLAAIEAPELRHPADVFQLRQGQRRPRRPPRPPTPGGGARRGTPRT